MMTEEQIVQLTHGHVWELITESGTRHLVDLRDPEGRVRRMRIPGSGRPVHRLDGRWQGRVSTVHHREMEESDDWGRGHEVVVGEPAIIPGPGVGDWHRTSSVLAVRALDENEVPPLGKVAYEPDDGLVDR